MSRSGQQKARVDLNGLGGLTLARFSSPGAAGSTFPMVVPLRGGVLREIVRYGVCLVMLVKLCCFRHE